MSGEIGPNVKRLIIHKMSLIAIPAGTGNALGAGVSVLTNPDRFTAVAKEATNWVRQAITVMKTAPDNPYKDDEEIAAAILAGIEARKT